GGGATQRTPNPAEYIGVSVEGPFKPDTYRY
ncbi:adenosylhomocysteinase, partial [Pseudomonas aeruginosa]